VTVITVEHGLAVVDDDVGLETAWAACHHRLLNMGAARPLTRVRVRGCVTRARSYLLVLLVADLVETVVANAFVVMDVRVS